VIHGTPKVMPLAIDLCENFAQRPQPVRIGSHPVDPVSSDFRCKHRAKSSPSVPHRFVADVDAALVKQVLDIQKRKWEPDIHHHHQASDFWAIMEVLEGIMFRHGKRSETSTSVSTGVILTMLTCDIFLAAKKIESRYH
jgi:hypothetical protein